MNFIYVKGLALAAVSCLGSFAAMAEGYQVNTLSSSQLGMGHTGIAMKLGAESQFLIRPVWLSWRIELRLQPR